MEDVNAKLAELTKTVDELASREAIREALYRINRGMDRRDKDLMGSGFHPDARIQWGTPDATGKDEWLEAGFQMQFKTHRAQHLIGNILIDLQGDKANVESYEVARHTAPIGDAEKDLTYSARYIDKFSRRNGEWKIDSRVKVMDWVRIYETPDPAYDMMPLKGQRDTADVSFQHFGEKPFHARS